MDQACDVLGLNHQGPVLRSFMLAMVTGVLLFMYYVSLTFLSSTLLDALCM